MLRTSLNSLAGLVMAAMLGASGCATFGNGGAVFRGQDNLVDPPVAPMLEGAVVDPPIAPPVEPVPGQAVDQPVAQGGPAYQGGQYVPGDAYGGEYCPPGQGTYPAMVIGGQGYYGGGCPGGYCGGNGLDWYPRHHHTYSYSRPNNLRYPTPNCPAGAIVYPYYTLRGPSDFFRQK